MEGTKMRKLCVFIVRENADDILNDIIAMGCLEVIASEDLPPDSDLYDFARRELIDISAFDAGKDHISVLGTKYTQMLSGWVSPRAEPELSEILDKHLCAWEIRDPTEHEQELAPVELIFPWFFKTYRLAGRSLFSPLRKGSRQPEPEEQEDEASI